MSKQDTKTTLLDVGTQLFLEYGFHATGINELLDLSGVPKGSFYHHFDTKEAFGVQVLDRFDQEYIALLNVFMADKTHSPLHRLRAYFQENIRRLIVQDCKQGCLIGNLAQEMTDHSELFRLKLDTVMITWIHIVADCLRQAQQQGELNSERNVDDLAQFCWTSWQGAVMYMKVTQSPEPLYAFVSMCFDVILK